jgi:hypothetical protein
MLDDNVIYYDPMVQKRIDEIVPGDMIDLENDPIADPDGDHIQFKSELYMTEEIQRESDDCIVLYSQSGNFAFPPEHIVNVGGHDYQTGDQP